MATRKAVTIGPFSRGLNTYDDPTALHDQECVESLNFDPGLDGSLRNRPPFTDTGSKIPIGPIGIPHLLGYYYDTNGLPYLIASNGDSSTYYYSGGIWTLITNTFSATDVTQFDGKAWLVAPVGEADPGGYWTPSGGFTAVTDMPKGTSITSYKSRLWVAQGVGGANPTRIYYSKVLGQPDFWNTPAFLDVGSGDGQNIVKIVTYYGVMLVFRTKSIWSFQYSTDPASAIQGVVVPGIGLQSPYALVAYENYLYFMYDESAYSFINNRAQQINTKVPFSTGAPGSTKSPYAVSLFNNRILYSFFENIYVYSLRTQTWSKWRSDTHGPIGQVMMPMTDELTGVGYAMSTRGSTTEVSLLRIEDQINDNAEAMQCVLVTKNYNFDSAGSFKVLFWWGVDAIFRLNVRGQVIPGVYSFSTMWGDLREKGITWGQLLAGTWQHPYMSDPSVVTNVTSNSGPIRKFVKFLKKLRFRQLQFRVSFETDGSAASAPVQLFTLSTYMAEKQTVSKEIS